MKTGKAKKATELDEREWNFSAVDEVEIVACCFWEYARESKTICEAVKSAKRDLTRQGKAVPETPERQAFRDDVTRAFGLLHKTGFPLEFWTGQPFPKPWQCVDNAKRKQWAEVVPDKIADAVKFPAFQVTNDLNTALALAGAAQKSNRKKMVIYRALAESEQGAEGLANTDESDKLRKILAEKCPLTIQGEGGVDSFIVQINWAQFSKTEIKACFNQWVDSYTCLLAKPSERGRGKTSADWRARLERLGLLRLRRGQTADQAIQTIAKTLQPNQRNFEKFNNTSECNREAVKAGDDFSTLFKFLPETMPTCLMD